MSQFSKLARLPGIGPQIHISKLTLTGSKHKKHFNPLIIIYTYILMGLPTYFGEKYHSHPSSARCKVFLE
jgi:hypothetical protein